MSTIRASGASQPRRRSGGGRPSAAARKRARQVRRRRLAAIAITFVAAVGLAVVALAPRIPDAVQELTLPLKHEDIIRQQAKDKGIDPSLIAAIIYAESRFRDQTSQTGARGLMQLQPSTADFIARDSGGHRFTAEDLATPQINIAYGAYYLRYLERRFDGDDVKVIAAYNGGETNIERWAGDGHLEVSEITFPETRHYVERVLDARSSYRKKYGDELGL